MPPASHNDINLLPHDLRRDGFGKKTKKTSLAVEYIKPSDQARRADQKKNPSFFARLFSIFKKGKEDKSESRPQKEPEIEVHALPKIHKLPKGRPLPSALFRGLDDESKTSAKLPAPSSKAARYPSINGSAGVSAGSVMSMHSPDFLPAKPPVGPITTSIPDVKGKPTFFVEKPSYPRPQKARYSGNISEIEEPEDVKQIKRIEPAMASSVSGTAQSGETSAPVHRVSGFDVNLLSEEYTKSFKEEKPRFTLAICAGATVIAVVLMYFGIHVYQLKGEGRLEAGKRVLAALEETVATYKSLESEDSRLRAKADALNALLARHVSWRSFLGRLEEETIPEVTYLSIAASTEGKMSISALAQDYTSLARQITVFQNTPWIKELTVTSASLTEESATMPGGVSFDIQIIINKEALLRAE